MKQIRLIFMVLLAAGVFAPLQAQLYETSAEQYRSERRLQMDAGTSSWALPLSSQALRSHGGSAKGITGGNLVAIGANTPTNPMYEGALPQVQFGRGKVGGELVSDPTSTITSRRRIGEDDDDEETKDRTEVHPNPMGEVPFALMLLLASLFAVLHLHKRRLSVA